MLLLLVFTLLAGAGTAITPCVLPVLPAILSAGATGGRRRPLGIVLGLALTFTIAIVALAQLVKGVGLASGAARTLAIVVLIIFGIALLVPSLGERIQAPLSRLARFGPKNRGDGFWTGLSVGAALGFVCAPCAGPILAAVTSVSASTGPTVRVVLVALAYSLGLSAVMLLYAFGGRAVLSRIRTAAKGRRVELVLGVMLVATGVAMIFNLDTRFDEAIASHGAIPGFFQDPTKSLEDSKSAQNRIAHLLRKPSPFATAQKQATTAPANPTAPGVAITGVKTPTLAKLGPAPAFKNTQDWFNTPDDHSLTLASLRGHVVLIDFWTYTCINCIRTLPFVEGLYQHYHRYGLDIIGVETPEFTFEQNANNLRQAITADHLTYPIVQDNHYGTWNAYGNEYWPAEYLIDATGQVRHTQFGEGDYKQDEAAVRALLYEAGAHHLPAPMTAHAKLPSADLATPETYLDPARSDTFSTKIYTGQHAYQATKSLSLNEFTLNGIWSASKEALTPVSGKNTYIKGVVQAQDVYLVMTSKNHQSRTGQILINGKRPLADERGSNVNARGQFSVKGQRLYNLVHFPADQHFTITVKLPAGVSAYDFTFG